jgi:hypothetical protein
MSARMFEVFAGLSSKISENNKQLLQTVEAIKVTYLDLKDNMLNLEESPVGIEGGISTSDQGVISMGTRGLIEEIAARKRKKIEDSNIEDAQEIEE